MKDQYNYFSHDGNARNDSKVLKLRMRHGAAGYGVYFMILERLREEDGYVSVKDYNMIAFDLRVDASLIKSVVEDFGLFAFTEDGECFYSESFNRRMSVKDEVKRMRSEAGKKGGAPAGNNNASKNENKQMVVLKQAKTSNCLNENKQKQANGCFETSKENKGKENKEKKKKEEEEREKKSAAADTFSDSEGEKQLDKDLHMLTANKTWREAVCMQHNIPDADAYRRLVGDFRTECICNGKTRHNGLQDLRSHFNSWLRIRLQKGVPKETGQRAPYVVAPSAEEEARERSAKEEQERKRVLGIYESAKQGNKRMLAIVSSWAQNGTLAEYGLEAL